MAITGGPNWSTKDYFDPFPGMEAGARRRQQNENERATKVREAQSAQEQGMRREDAAMRQADALARMGVDPVMGPDGKTDWQATGKLATLKDQITKQAVSLGTLHGWAGPMGPLTEQETALTQTPEYQNALRMAGSLREQADQKRIAEQELEGIRAKNRAEAAAAEADARAKSAENVARIRAGKTSGAIPKSDDEMRQAAIDDAIRLTDAKLRAKLTFDKQGHPVVQKEDKDWGGFGSEKPPLTEQELEAMKAKLGRKGGKSSGTSTKAGAESQLERWSRGELGK
jgi:hypothetical protein